MTTEVLEAEYKLEMMPKISKLSPLKHQIFPRSLGSRSSVRPMHEDLTETPSSDVGVFL
jgi:hypothetical protein